MSGAPRISTPIAIQTPPPSAFFGPGAQAVWQAVQKLIQRTGGPTGVDSAATLSQTTDNSLLLALTTPAPANTPVVTAPAAPVPITPGTSPYAYLAPAAGTVVVDGGTVSLVTLKRGSSSAITLPVGIAPVQEGDTVTVTYSVAPTMTLVPA